MARRYGEEDRAAVYLALQVNEGNVARTHRDTGVPEQTVRDWKGQFEKDGPPNLEVVSELHTDFLTTAERVRDKLIENYEKALDNGKISPDKMPIHIGILTDKVQLLKGMATSRSEGTVALPSPQAMRELAGGVFDAMLNAVSKQDERSSDIIDGDYEVVENKPKALSAAKE